MIPTVPMVFHRQGDVAKWRIVDRAIVFIGPGGVRKNAFDAEADFRFRLLFSDNGGQARSDFLAALGKIFGDVVEHLRAIVRGGFAPGFGFADGWPGRKALR